MDLKTLFQHMINKQASDLFLRFNSVPRVRIDGVVQEIGVEPISLEQMEKVTSTLLDKAGLREEFQKNKDVDFAHYEEAIGRFRVSIYMQRNTPALVARHVQTGMKTFEELNLPDEIFKNFCEESRGLVLLTGPAGSGKSTSISSMLEYINLNQQKNIVTLEDPIEFLFQDKKSLVSQREIGADVASYADGLKHVTQQSPDIIYIGNIRDVDTMKAAINATELGAFVVSTFHTVNAVQTITRIVNFFPPHLHDEVRMQLSVILKGIISLRLLPRKDNSGRVPAYESLVVTPTIARLIRENKITEIQNFIDEGQLFGMQSFKRSLVQLVKAGVVDVEDARRFADSKDDFNLEMGGVKRFTE